MQYQFTKYLSNKKTQNIFAVLCGYFIALIYKKPLKIGQPLSLSIEPVNYCNLSCPECPSGNGNLTRKKGQISMDLYKKIIEEIKDYVTYLTLYFQGEPFLHPTFIDFVQLAKQNNIYTSTSTNAQNINDEMAEKIVKSGLNKLIVSMDGTTQEVYEKYRVGGKLQTAENAITSIIKWKKKLNSATPYLELQFLVFKHNEHQIPEIKARAKQLEVNKLSLKTAQIYDFENGSDLIPIQKKFSRYVKGKDGKYIRKKKIRNHCWNAFSGAVISVNGDVLPCSFDKNGIHAFGNINEHSLANIWHNKKAHQFRKQILTDRKVFEMCQNCVM